jgi:hypothetical protein
MFRRTSENLLPKGLLQECLKPMLFSYRDLSVEGFKGLSRLLSLVSSCVATTLSDRLLSYIMSWPEAYRSRQVHVWVVFGCCCCCCCCLLLVVVLVVVLSLSL